MRLHLRAVEKIELEQRLAKVERRIRDVILPDGAVSDPARGLEG